MLNQVSLEDRLGVLLNDALRAGRSTHFYPMARAIFPRVRDEYGRLPAQRGSAGG
jgi:hypothetical protein